MSDLEIVSSTPQVMVRTELDSAIVTARQYPRNIAKVKTSIQSMATLDEETAEACFYKLQRGDKVIEGPSIRLAEIALCCFGNVNAGSRVLTVETGENPHVVIEAVCHDLENNNRITIQKRRRITSKKNKDGTRKPVDEDDINLAANAGSAIALRDAILKVIPGTLVKPALDAAKRVAIGDVKSFVVKRQQVVDRLKKMGVPEDRIFAAIEVKKMDEIDLSKLEDLIGKGTAIKEGTQSLEDAFPLLQKEDKTTPPADAKKGDKTTVALPKKREDASATPPADYAKQYHDRITAALDGTPFTLDDLLCICEREDSLKAASQLWTCIGDIGSAEAKFIAEHLNATGDVLFFK